MNYYNQPGTYPYGYPPLRPPIQQYTRPLRKWANIICFGLLLVHLTGIFAANVLFGLFGLIPFDHVDQQIVDLVDQSLIITIYAMEFLIPCLIIVALIKIPGKVAFPLRRPKASIAIPAVFVALGASIVGMLLSGTLAVILEFIFGVVPSMPDMDAPVGIPANVVYILSMTLAPAVLEEMLFRGVIMQSLRRFGDGFAIVTSAILFGLAHGNLIQCPNAIVIGLILGYFVVRTGSLITGMVIHFVNNALAVGMSYAMDYMPAAWADVAALGMYAAYAILGGAALVFLFVKHSHMFQVVPSDYPLRGSKKYSTFFFAAASIIYLVGSFILFIIYLEPATTGMMF